MNLDNQIFNYYSLDISPQVLITNEFFCFPRCFRHLPYQISLVVQSTFFLVLLYHPSMSSHGVQPSPNLPMSHGLMYLYHGSWLSPLIVQHSFPPTLCNAESYNRF